MPAFLNGLSAFPITPADAGGRVDVAALRALLGPVVAAKASSIGLLGSTGTYAYLTRAERRRALDAALEEVDRRVPVLVGIGALRADEVVQIARDAKAAGAAAGLLAAVSYTPLTEDEVFALFTTVAGESGLPLVIYDNPGTTHFRFSPALVARLAALPEVIAVKSPAPEAAAVGAHLAELRGIVPAGFTVGCSVDWHAGEALIAGADAWFSVAGGLFPRMAEAMVTAAQAGDAVEVRRLNGQFEPLWRLFRRHSSLRVVYACLDLLDICRAEPPRPILPLSDAARQEVADTLKGLDLSGWR